MLKYIIIRTQDQHGTNHDLPVLFPTAINHKEMYDSTRRAIRKSGTGHIWQECVGAGFCQVTGDIITCSGRSESLDIACRPLLDEQAIMRAEAFSKTNIETME